MDNKEIFASNLKRYMEEQGKSRKEVSDAIGVSYYTFTDWVNGKKYPRIDAIDKLASYFGISKSDLIEQKPSENERIQKRFESILNKKLGDYIRDYRNREKISLKRMADLCNLQEDDIFLLERDPNRAEVSPYVIIDTICNVIGIASTELFSSAESLMSLSMDGLPNSYIEGVLFQEEALLNRKKIASKIFLYRNEANLGRNQIAEKLGVGNKTILDWETGTVSIGAEQILNICKILGITVNQIYDLEEVDLLSGEASEEKIFSDHERAIISAYRDNPDMQGAVDRLLGVEREGADIAEDMIKTVRAGALVKKPTDTK